MVKVIDTNEMMARMAAYQIAGTNRINIGLLCVDLVILMKWTGKKPQDLRGEINYWWNTVHFDPTQKQH